MSDLKPRQKDILSALIERYVVTAEPVGSAVLALDPKLLALHGSLSSATLRNELAELESQGYLGQPHTSAGRVPTDAGYRLYVNEMMRPRALRPTEEKQLEEVATTGSVEDTLREATSLLARLTGYPAVANLPAAGRDTMRAVQLNPVPPHQLILVLVTAGGRIEHRLFEVEREITPVQLSTVVNFLNEQLGGRSLSAVRTTDFEVASRGLHEPAAIGLARRAWELVRQSVADLGDERIVVQGLITLLDEPEFGEMGAARTALRLFEDEMALAGVLRNFHESGRDLPTAQTVRIGRELQTQDNPAIRLFSFVGISYGSGTDTWGAVGVMGPARMRYSDAAALVPALVNRLQICLKTF